MKYKRLLQCVFVFVVLAVLQSQSSRVVAQDWWDQCTGGIYCTGPCDTVWDPPDNINNCACEAQLCDNYTLCPGNTDYQTCCNTHPELKDAYGVCSVCIAGCTVCGGTNIIQGTCKPYINPCINVCNGATPTPTPTTSPLCGNGTCAGTENCSNCWQDCGACPGPTPTPSGTCVVNGTCDAGETCSNCPSDCGACPTPTPPPTCGNGSCGAGESCSTCPSDCGPCPTPPCDAGAWGPWTSCTGSPATKTHTNFCGTPETVNCTGTIQARAVEVASSTATCDDTRASTTEVSPAAIHRFSAYPVQTPAPGIKIQNDLTYKTFADVVGGSYVINTTVPPGYVRANACWTRTLNSPLSDTGVGPIDLSVGLDNETLTWDLGYTLGTPWVQTGGGDVYAAGSVTSAVADLASPRVFSLNGPGGSPGVVRYGADYDFDADVTSKGETRVSSPKWLVQETDANVNYYDYFRIKLGGTFPPTSFPDLLAVSQPASSSTPYFVSGDMTTSGDWSVGNGETIIFIVNGNLTLGGKVNLTGSGFVAFIVNGDIMVSSSVGGAYTSNTPVIEGIYVTSKTGTFKTGTSTVVGKERLVLQGMFMAGGFLLQRDLDSVDANTTTSSELFLYNPRLLFSMPDSLRDVPITWEEVAP